MLELVCLVPWFLVIFPYILTVQLFFFFVAVWTVTGLVSDAFHLTFGCGLLTFSLFAMATSRKKPDHAYSYG